MHPEHDGTERDITELIAQMRAKAHQLLAKADKLEAQHQIQPETAREKARRRWTGAGGIAAIITATGMLRETAKQSPGVTASAAGAATMALGAMAALTLGIGGDQRPTIAEPRPSITQPTDPPSVPPIDRRDRRAKQVAEHPERQQDISTVRVDTSHSVVTQPESPNVDRDVPVTPPVLADPPPPIDAPPIETATPSRCAARVRLFEADVRLLCRR